MRVLDYGCGRSVLLDVFGKFVDDHRSAFRRAVDQHTPLEILMTELAPGIAAALAPLPSDDYASLQTQAGLISKERFDPAIPEYAALPQGPYDFLICTDVFEHIPEFGTNHSCDPVLQDAVQQVLGLSQNPFLNISTRRAMQILPDGQNAHCTLKDPQQWLQLLRQENSDIAPMFSRDFTSCHFVSGHLGKAFHDASYAAYDRYGEVDLIAYPSKKTLPPEKEQSLIVIQPHKADIRNRNLEWWKTMVDPRPQGLDL